MYTRVKENIKKLSYHIPFEVILNLFGCGIVIYSFYLSYFNTDFFFEFYDEDKFVEWTQFVCLMVLSGIYLKRFFTVKNSKFSWITFLISLTFLLFALEEISYGQRIFNFESPAFFKTHHYHKMLNFHNLYYDGLWGLGNTGDYFPWLMLALFGLYMHTSIYLYKRIKFFNKLVKICRISLPKLSQIGLMWFMIIVACVSKITPLDKGGIVQFLICITTVIVTLFPKNKVGAFDENYD